MNILALTISYLNDNEFISQWAEPFYASLKDKEKAFNSYSHEIVLNDKNPNKAKENLSKLIKKYDIHGYEPNFTSTKSVDKSINYSLNHGKALCRGFRRLKNKEIQNFDIILIQEYDVIHGVNFFDKLLKLKKTCCSLDLLAGEIIYRMYVSENDEKVSVGSLGKKAIFYFPRIIPSFLICPPSLYNELFMYSDRWERLNDSKIKRASARLNDNSNDNVVLTADLGSSFFRNWIKRNSFLHLNEEDFYSHLRSITVDYSEIIDEDLTSLEKEEKIKGFEKKHKYVKSLNIPFKTDSVFNKKSESMINMLRESLKN